MGRIITKAIDTFMNKVHKGEVSMSSDENSQHKRMAGLQVMMFVANTVLSIWPMICYVLLAQNIHMVFWLGTLVQDTNLLVPVTQFSMSGSLSIFMFWKVNPRVVKHTTFLIFQCAGCVLITAGAYVMWEAHHVSHQLIDHCGQDPLTRKIESEWQKLKAFSDECAEQMGERPAYIQLCPGFETSQDQIYVEYIEDMELDYDCAGFCTVDTIEPFFNPDSHVDRRCSKEIGDNVRRVSKAVGIPTLLNGVLMMLIGLALMEYNHI